MVKNSSSKRDIVFDLESGLNSVTKEHEGENDTSCSAGQEKGVLSRGWSGFASIDGLIKDGGAVKLDNITSSSVDLPLTNEEALVAKRVEQEGKLGLSEKKIGVKKPKKKGCKKPPKPPRHPNAPPLDAADQKLMQEITEIAMLKQARIERMKKKLKNAKMTHSSNNLWALIITILFLLIVIWQGVFSRGSSSVGFRGSPESSLQTRGGLISIQFYKNKNASKNVPQASSSVSPNAEPVSGSDDHKEAITDGPGSFKE